MEDAGTKKRRPAFAVSSACNKDVSARTGTGLQRLGIFTLNAPGTHFGDEAFPTETKVVVTATVTL